MRKCGGRQNRCVQVPVHEAEADQGRRHVWGLEQKKDVFAASALRVSWDNRQQTTMGMVIGDLDVASEMDVAIASVGSSG